MTELSFPSHRFALLRGVASSTGYLFKCYGMQELIIICLQSSRPLTDCDPLQVESIGQPDRIDFSCGKLLVEVEPPRNGEIRPNINNQLPPPVLLGHERSEPYQDRSPWRTLLLIKFYTIFALNNTLNWMAGSRNGGSP